MIERRERCYSAGQRRRFTSVRKIFGEEAEGLKTRGYGRGHRNMAEAERGKDIFYDATELM